jgi:hypothetical protein
MLKNEYSYTREYTMFAPEKFFFETGVDSGLAIRVTLTRVTRQVGREYHTVGDLLLI